MQLRRGIGVLVVDDHSLVVDALAVTLGMDERLQVVGCAESGADAVHLAGVLEPDVILMDLHMPAMDGIETTRRVRHVSPQTRVIMLSATRAPDEVAYALAAGAARYLSKDTPALRLIETVIDVASRTDATVIPLRRLTNDGLTTGRTA